MDQILPTILEKILLFVGHEPEEASKLAAQLAETIGFMSLTYLIARQPTESRDAMTAHIATINTPAKLEEFIGQFSEEDRLSSLREAAQDVVETYFAEVGPALTTAQKQRIAIFLMGLQEGAV